MSKNRVVGLWSGHDTSFCVLEDGKPLMHTELERHNREKEPAGDSIELFKKHFGDSSNIAAFTTCFMKSNVTKHEASYASIKDVAPLIACGHHQAHAANAFYSSNFDEALILTLDGGGFENEGNLTAGTTAWRGRGTKLESIFVLPLQFSNIGGVWTRVTRYIFGYESGWPYGHQAGTVMALAALGDPQKYISDFRRFFRGDLEKAGSTPSGHIKGMSVKDPLRPRHPFLGKWEDIAKANEQEKYNMAAALQQATEEHTREILQNLLIKYPEAENLCIAGGVALNSVMTGKIKSWFPQLKNIYVPPVPFDGGLSIGSAQWYWHNELGNPRVKWEDSFPPYLGTTYTKNDVEYALANSSTHLNVMTDINDEFVTKLIADGNIISVFNGKAESGRRALGNRSILADPRSPTMKDKVNLNVKHRQSFRPFAPSILHEDVSEWFTDTCDSPYMGFVLHFKPEKAKLVPAVAHFDGTARLQTVKESDNNWYYHFLKKWKTVSGVPIILNTSLNDTSPICETPDDAIKCFCGTEMDYIYFPEFGLLACK